MRVVRQVLCGGRVKHRLERRGGGSDFIRRRLEILGGGDRWDVEMCLSEEHPASDVLQPIPVEEEDLEKPRL